MYTYRKLQNSGRAWKTPAELWKRFHVYVHNRRRSDAPFRTRLQTSQRVEKTRHNSLYRNVSDTGLLVRVSCQSFRVCEVPLFVSCGAACLSGHRSVLEDICDTHQR